MFYVFPFSVLYTLLLQFTDFLKFHSKLKNIKNIKKYIENKKDRFNLFIFRSSSSVPNCHRKSG